MNKAQIMTQNLVGLFFFRLTSVKNEFNDIATELSKPDCREIINSEIVDDSVLFAYNVDTVL